MSTQPPNPPAAYCRQCGRPLREEDKRDVRGMIFCEDCLTAVVTGNIPRAVPPPPIGVAPLSTTPNPWIAAVLGCIPGVGAMYNGQFAKGFVHVVILASLFAMSEHTGGMGSAFFDLLIPAFWIYMVIDAFQTARARQLSLPLPDPFGFNNVFGTAFGGTHNVPGTNGSPVPPAQVPFQSQAAYQVPPQSRFVPDNSARCNQPIGAFVLIGLGAFFLLGTLGFINHLVTRMLWPGVLIGLGVWLFIRRQNEVVQTTTTAGIATGTEKTEDARSVTEDSGEQK